MMDDQPSDHRQPWLPQMQQPDTKKKPGQAFDN